MNDKGCLTCDNYNEIACPFVADCINQSHHVPGSGDLFKKIKLLREGIKHTTMELDNLVFNQGVLVGKKQTIEKVKHIMQKFHYYTCDDIKNAVICEMHKILGE